MWALKLLNEFCSVNYQIFKNTYWTHIEYNYTLKSKSENSRYAFVAVGYLDSFSCVSSISILSMTAGSGRPSTGSREKLFPTVMRPRSCLHSIIGCGGLRDYDKRGLQSDVHGKSEALLSEIPHTGSGFLRSLSRGSTESLFSCLEVITEILWRENVKVS